MADSIQISTQTLLDTAEKVTSLNTTMDEKLQEINKEMNALESTWNSEAATEIRAAMNALNPKFEEYKTVVASYAKFLTTTAQTYETTESTIKSNASAFK